MANTKFQQVIEVSKKTLDALKQHAAALQKAGNDSLAKAKDAAKILRSAASSGGLSPASVDRLGASFAQAASKAKALKGVVQDLVVDIGKLGAGAGVGVVGAVAAARAADPTEEIANLNIQTGMSLRTLSALRQAARMAGLEFDEVKAALVAVPQILGEAYSGDSGPIELLTRMKLSVEELKKMPLDQAITQVMLQLGRLKADPQAVPLISAIVGEDVQSKLMPALRLMADNGIEYFAKKAEEAGTMVTESSAKTAKNTNNAIRDMQTSLDGLAIAVSQKAGPNLEYLAKLFKDKIGRASCRERVSSPV
mgnify:CR=1 FL=1